MSDTTTPPPTEQLQRIQQAILQVVHQQLKDNTPPQTGETLDRLLCNGFTRSQAMDLIGRVVALEVAEVIQKGTPFDLERYTARLSKLPDLFDQDVSE
jgi:hypothetical protein